jgi:purine-cytosine permease-like protein
MQRLRVLHIGGCKYVGLGAAGALLLTLATLTTNFVNIYMSSLAWKSLVPRASDGAVIWSIGIVGTALSAVPGVWLEQYTSFMTVLGAVLVPVGGVLVAHYYIQRPHFDEAFIQELYNPAGSCRGVSIAGVAAWGAGAAAFFAAGSSGGGCSCRRRFRPLKPSTAARRKPMPTT